MSLKNKIAEFLEQNRGCAVSGQEIADKLNVSRAAVWKAVNQLKEEGYRITAGRNKGYILEEQTDVLSQSGIRHYLPERYKNNEIRVFECVGSTNTAAKTLALQGVSEGAIIAADSQSEGRGRLGREFYSPAGTGLYMSVILKPNKPLSDCTFLTLAAAVSAAEGIERVCGVNAGIKWVNDIFLEGKKIGGILTEAISDFESGMTEAVIVGIGINITTESFPEALHTIAGSIGKFTERNRLCAEIAARLLDYSADDNRQMLLNKYRERSIILGRKVSFMREGQTICGTALEIGEDGSLSVRTEKEILRLHSGEVSIRTENK